MNKTPRIAISSDSAIDITEDLREKFDIHTVPFSIIMGEEADFDDDSSAKKVFAYTEKTGKLARTAAVNEAQCEAHFGKLLESYDAIIHFTISSDMSASYANSVSAAKKFENVFVVDSRELSTGIALEAIYARRLAEQGIPIEEIVAKVKERIPYVQASFACEAVDYLYKGGRCSSLSALGANILKIRPQIIVKDGKMIQGKKFRGPMKKWVPQYIEETLRDFKTPDHSLVFVTFSSAPKEVQEIATDLLKKAGFKEIYLTTAGGTVACHCGPQTLGILFINDGDGEH